MHAIYIACLGMLRAGGGREGGTEGFMQLLRCLREGPRSAGPPARCAMSDTENPQHAQRSPTSGHSFARHFAPRQL